MTDEAAAIGVLGLLVGAVAVAAPGSRWTLAGGPPPHGRLCRGDYRSLMDDERRHLLRKSSRKILAEDELVAAHDH